MKLHYLKQKLVWQMTGEELVQLIRSELSTDTISIKQFGTKTRVMEQKYVYGLKGMAKLLGCSVSSAQRLKKSGKINNAIIQDGRKIIVDVDKALYLIKNPEIAK